MSTISASTTSTTAYKVTADTTGALVLQTGATPTTAVTISSAQVATFAQAPVLPSASIPQAALASNVAGTGPAFSAYQSSSQTLSSNTNTKILFQTEEFDTNNNFASSTFTPTVAGYYQVTGSIRIGASATQVRTFIYKNGSSYKLGTDVSSCFNAMASTLVYLNGSTDYVEFYALFTTGQSTSAASAETWFNGCLVRAA